MSAPEKSRFTEKQKHFCEEYIANGFNAQQAYMKAFNKDRITDASYPYTLLSKPHIKEYIDKRRKEIYDALNIDAMRVIQELADMAFASKDDQVYVPSIKLRALEQLSKNLGLQTQKIETDAVIEVTLDGEMEINEDNSPSEHIQ